MKEQINKSNYESFLLDYIEGNLEEPQRLMVENFLEQNPHLREEFEAFDLVQLKKPQSPSVLEWDSLKKKPQELATDAEKEVLFIKAMEEDLNDDEVQLFEKLMASPVHKADYDKWKNLKLKPKDTYLEKSALFEFGLDSEIAEWNYESYLTAFSEQLLNDEQMQRLQTYAASLPNGEDDLKLAASLRLKAPKGITFQNKAALKKPEKAGLVIWLYRASAVAAAVLLGVFLWNTPFQSDTEETAIAEEQKIPEQQITGQSDPDSAKGATPAIQSNDTLEIESQQLEEAPLLEWEVREPDPNELAQDLPSEAPAEKIVIEKDTLSPILIEENKLNPVGTENFVASIDSLESPLESDSMAIQFNPDFLAKKETRVEPQHQKLNEIAEEALANRLDMSDEERDQMALTIAKRLTSKASELLDAELKKEEFEESEHLTYTLRVGSFKLKHSRKK